VVPADRPRVEQYREAVLGGFHTVDCEYRVQLPNGQMRWVRDMVRTTSTPGDPERRIRGVTMDVTTEHEASDQLQAAVKMQSDFVSFASHQLRTPLTGINWMLELAAAEPVDSPDLPGFIKDALESSQRLVGLVNDLLGISRLESGRLVVKPESIELTEMTREIASDLAPLVAKQEHRLDMSGVEGPANVFADRQLLKQALANLCSNAIKYTPRGGDIIVRVTGGDVIRFEVQDSGIGVPESARARLFGKFFRAENVSTVETEGTGLGLYIVRLIVERSGGEVWYEPAEPRGSRFIVQLPAELPLTDISDEELYGGPPADMPSETGATDE
jgi:signal transduction histidine kinase